MDYDILTLVANNLTIEKRLREGKKDIMYREVQQKEMNVRQIWSAESKLTKKEESQYWIHAITEMIHGIGEHKKIHR